MASLLGIGMPDLLRISWLGVWHLRICVEPWTGGDVVEMPDLHRSIHDLGSWIPEKSPPTLK